MSENPVQIILLAHIYAIIDWMAYIFFWSKGEHETTQNEEKTTIS